jgi:hypothetical protein
MVGAGSDFVVCRLEFTLRRRAAEMSRRAFKIYQIYIGHKSISAIGNTDGKKSV